MRYVSAILAIAVMLGSSPLVAQAQSWRPFVFNDPATTEIYTVSDTLSLHDALPISTTPPTRVTVRALRRRNAVVPTAHRAPSATRSEEHTSELQSPDTISYAVF